MDERREDEQIAVMYSASDRGSSEHAVSAAAAAKGERQTMLAAETAGGARFGLYQKAVVRSPYEAPVSSAGV